MVATAVATAPPITQAPTTQAPTAPTAPAATPQAPTAPAARTGRPRRQLTGVDRAAALLVALGPELSSKVLQSMEEHEIESLTLRIASLDGLTREERDQVITAAREAALARKYVMHGGIDYARRMLSLALGPEKANELVERVAQMYPPPPFAFLRKSDAKQLAGFLQDEHPQTIALILSHLPPVQAAAVLTSLNEELQADVARRIATMGRTPPEIVARVEEVIRRRLSSLIAQDSRHVGGTEYLVAVLTTVDRSTEKHILDRLAETDPALAEEVRKMMFTFDDLIRLDDRSIQRVLRDVDMRDLALALKAAKDDLRELIFSNMSTRAAEMLREEIAYLGPVRIHAVEEAQQRIVTVVRRLEEAEEIVIDRGEGGGLLA
ncbi:MAG: flagellar motor switch protein FliG [Sphaerobacter sp.]|nr:flagellar motor switch protein FliG [Sphaerobacter sp.]